MHAKHIGKSQLVAEIARGGMGIVYLALAQGPARFNKLHVVKQLKQELGEDAAFVEMFLEEARLAARLNHPNIVQTHEVGFADGRYHLVMDYLEGATLSRISAKKSPAFSLGMRLRTVCEVLRALDYAHTLVDLDGTPLRLVHRDVTPQNVFLTFDGHIKLMDFGIAKAHDSGIETQAGVLKGKPAYMAPEQIAGKSDGRSDIFSTGVVLWELLAGRRMWEQRNQVDILTSIVNDQIPKLAEAAPHVPDALVRIVDKATAREPDDRYASAAEFLDALERYMQETRQDASSRDLGKFMGALFAESRKRIQEILERHLQRNSILEGAELLPSLPPVGRDSLTSTSTIPRRLSNYPTMRTSMTGTGTGTPAVAELTIDRSKKPGSRKLRYGAIALGALGLAGAIGLSIVNTARRTAALPPQPMTIASPPAAAPKESAVAPSPAEHEVFVSAAPKTALISVDGVAMPNPARRSCKHGEHLQIRITAPGHIARDREVRCEFDEHLDFTLAATAQTIVVAPPPVAAPHAPAAPAAAPTPKPDPMPDVPKTPPSPPRHHAAPLDTNPFR